MGTRVGGVPRAWLLLRRSRRGSGISAGGACGRSLGWAGAGGSGCRPVTERGDRFARVRLKGPVGRVVEEDQRGAGAFAGLARQRPGLRPARRVERGDEREQDTDRADGDAAFAGGEVARARDARADPLRAESPSPSIRLATRASRRAFCVSLVTRRGAGVLLVVVMVDMVNPPCVWI